MPRALGWIVLLVAAPALASKKDADPMTKVLGSLQEMLAQGQREAQAAEIEFEEFTHFCHDNKIDMNGEVIKTEEDLKRQKAENAKLVSEAVAIGHQIEEIHANLENMNEKLANHTSERKEAHSNFIDTQKDYAESIDALDGAVNVLSKQDKDHPGGEVLLQLSDSDKLPVQAKSVVAEFMTMMNGDSSKDAGAPSADAYEFQSGGVLDMVKKLRDEFADKKHDLEQDEMNSAHSFKMMKADLTDAIALAEKDVNEKSQTKAGRLYRISMGEKNVALYSHEELEEKERFEALKQECGSKEAVYTEEKKVRDDEIAALSKALGVLSQAQVGDKYAKHVGLVQQSSSATSLSQLRATTKGVRHRLREFLSSEARRLKNQDLTLLATKLVSDPFAKVKTMIDDMITHLEEEASADADKHEFCEKETEKSSVTRTKLTEEIETMTSRVDDKKASLQEIVDENAQLSKDLAAIGQEIATQTKIRDEDKAQNEQVIADTSSSLEAMQVATKTLKDFYSENAPATAASAASFAQEPYSGQQTASVAVLALMDIITESFSDLLADTKAAEGQAAHNYKVAMDESRKVKKVKESKTQWNEEDRVALESRIREDEADLKAVQDQLTAAEHYFQKIDEQCSAKGMSYEDRAKAREDEIDSLKQAMEILAEEGSPVEETPAE